MIDISEELRITLITFLKKKNNTDYKLSCILSAYRTIVSLEYSFKVEGESVPEGKLATRGACNNNNL